MKEEAILLNIRGIKCDHCDYKDETIPAGEYEQWLNKPCPKCGANLLTQEDYDLTIALIGATKILNAVLPKTPKGKKKRKYAIEMDGTGSMTIKPAEQ